MEDNLPVKIGSSLRLCSDVALRISIYWWLFQKVTSIQLHQISSTSPEDRKVFVIDDNTLTAFTKDFPRDFVDSSVGIESLLSQNLGWERVKWDTEIVDSDTEDFLKDFP